MFEKEEPVLDWIGRKDRRASYSDCSLEREVIGSKGLKQNDSSSTRAVKIARRTLDE